MTEVSPPSSLSWSCLPQGEHQHQPAVSLPFSYSTGKENGGEDASANNLMGEITKTITDKVAAAIGSQQAAPASASVPPSCGSPPPPPPQVEQQQQQEQPEGPSPTVTEHNDSINNINNSASPFPTTSPTVEEHLERLRTDFADLLTDTVGDQRMAFLPAPDLVTSLLSEAWNKGTGAVPTATTKNDTNRMRHVVDRVDRKLKPVQTFFPNLLNYLLTSPGFPTGSNDDGAIFQSFSYTPAVGDANGGDEGTTTNRVQEAEDYLTGTLHQQLVEMGYADYSQRVIFYLSFLKSKEYMLQEAHVDYKWPVVNPFQKDDDDVEVNYCEDNGCDDENDEQDDYVEASKSNKKRKRERRRVNVTKSTSSSTRSSRSSNRTASRRNNNKKNKRGPKLDKRQTYKRRVPFIVLFPLTPAGMTIEIWKARGPNHKPSGDDDDCGRIVHLPFGTMALLRGDVLHAGGFINNEETGDPRAHLYVYRDDGELHDINIKNTYDLPSTTLLQWAAAMTASADAQQDQTAAAAAAVHAPALKSKHVNKKIVPFSHLYQHHPQRILHVREHGNANKTASACAAAAAS